MTRSARHPEGGATGSVPSELRAMQFVCRQEGDLLLLDPSTDAMHTLPEDRTYLDVTGLEPGSDVVVVHTSGQPVWVASRLGSEQRNLVTLDHLYEFLHRHRRSNLVVEFEDGDRYLVSALDLCGENPDGEFEIVASFADCLGRSETEARALEAGSLKRSPPNIGWTTVAPSRPVSMTYTTRRIRAVYDVIAGSRVYVYEREPTPAGRL